MLWYKVKAKVLNFGLGELIITREILAENEKQAEKNFIEKYLTIEILNVTKY